MKYLITALLLITVFLSACSRKAPPTPPAPDSIPADDTSAITDPGLNDTDMAGENNANIENDNINPLNNRIVLDGKSSFRGLVSDIAEEGERTVATLTAPPGSDYDTREMKFYLDDEAEYNFERTDLAKDMFLEVYYDQDGDSYTARALNNLGNIDDTIFNGEIIDIRPNVDDATRGALLIKSMDGNREHLFNYDENSKYDLDINSLKPGDRLHVFHSPSSTKSIPPQSNVYSFSKYVDYDEPDVLDNTAASPADDNKTT